MFLLFYKSIDYGRCGRPFQKQCLKRRQQPILRHYKGSEKMDKFSNFLLRNFYYFCADNFLGIFNP